MKSEERPLTSSIVREVQQDSAAPSQEYPAAMLTAENCGRTAVKCCWIACASCVDVAPQCKPATVGGGGCFGPDVLLFQPLTQHVGIWPMRCAAI